MREPVHDSGHLLSSLFFFFVKPRKGKKELREVRQCCTALIYLGCCDLGCCNLGFRRKSREKKEILYKVAITNRCRELQLMTPSKRYRSGRARAVREGSCAFRSGGKFHLISIERWFDSMIGNNTLYLHYAHVCVCVCVCCYQIDSKYVINSNSLSLSLIGA